MICIFLVFFFFCVYKLKPREIKGKNQEIKENKSKRSGSVELKVEEETNYECGSMNPHF